MGYSKKDWLQHKKPHKLEIKLPGTSDLATNANKVDTKATDWKQNT